MRKDPRTMGTYDPISRLLFGVTPGAPARGAPFADLLLRFAKATMGPTPTAARAMTPRVPRSSCSEPPQTTGSRSPG